MVLQIKSLEDTKKLAEQLAHKAISGNIYALKGDLGSGKTTFTGFFTRALLGKNARVQSPTFVIARTYTSDVPEYVGAINKIFHLDLYRFHSEHELKELDLEDFFACKNSVTLIEWPEIATHFLPKGRTININFEYIDETKRNITIQDLH